jgi:hypothetical protein
VNEASDNFKEKTVNNPLWREYIRANAELLDTMDRRARQDILEERASVLAPVVDAMKSLQDDPDSGVRFTFPGIGEYADSELALCHCWPYVRCETPGRLFQGVAIAWFDRNPRTGVREVTVMFNPLGGCAKGPEKFVVDANDVRYAAQHVADLMVGMVRLNVLGRNGIPIIHEGASA